MSIATKTGDQGTTGLLYGKRVSKTDPRIACNGAVDELNAAMGLARASLKGTVGEPFITEPLKAIQKELIVLMGEIAVATEDRERHRNSSYGIVTPEKVEALSARIDDLEKNHQIEFHRWATPGDSMGSATLEVARTICRRAERLVVGLRESDETLSSEIARYLNRLSDLLWLWARWVETVDNRPAPPAAV
jgi:cob(I)alamin adenosyltransferase